jgi:lysozyme
MVMNFNQAIAKRLAAYGLSGALVLAGAGTVSYYEGVSNKAYLDPVGIWTICYGETKGVNKGDYKTDEECLDSLAEELTEHHKKMVMYIKTPISEKEEAAYLSFTYNVGVGAFSKSTLLSKLNSGDRVGACNQLLRWDKAGGKKLKGLTLRRHSENKLCLEGVQESNETSTK